MCLSFSASSFHKKQNTGIFQKLTKFLNDTQPNFRTLLLLTEISVYIMPLHHAQTSFPTSTPHSLN